MYYKIKAMKIIVTGSLGYVSTPLIQQLVEKGHLVTVISSKAERQAAIEAMGAKAAIGSMYDAVFLTDTFTGADAVYCMIVPGGGNLFDPNVTVRDVMADADKITNNYVQAIAQSGVKQVVYLSTVGAHMDKDNGLLAFHHYAEKTLNQLPAGVAIAFMRPVGFYKNLFSFVNAIKYQGVIASNYGADDVTSIVAASDIAEAIVEELTTPFTGRKVRYIASEELTCNQIAHTLGAAIGKPDLQWVLISDAQQLDILKSFGMNASIAESFVEMNAGIHSGKIAEDYNLHKPTLGKVKLTEFAKEFAAVYNQ